MKSNLTPLLIALFASGFTHAAVITDFSTFTASGTLLPSPNNSGQTVTTTTGVGTNTVTFTDVADSINTGQVVYLSDSFSLTAVGSRISVDFDSFAGTANNSQAIGLAVASSESLASRQNLIIFFWRRQGNHDYLTFNGDDPALFSSAANVNGTPDSLFIERTGTGYKLGSITAAVETTHHTLTIGVDNVTADGSAVGLYSDVRNNGNVNTVKNFAVTIPEPSTALLGTFGLLALLRRRR